MASVYRFCVVLFSLLFFSASFAGTGMSCLNPDPDEKALKNMRGIDPKASKANVFFMELYHVVLFKNDHKQAAKILQKVSKEPGASDKPFVTIDLMKRARDLRMAQLLVQAGLVRKKIVIHCCSEYCMLPDMLKN